LIADCSVVYQKQQTHSVANYFSGPGRAIRLVFVSLCVRTVTWTVWPRHLACSLPWYSRNQGHILKFVVMVWGGGPWSKS